ncbi:MAG: F0F1 ATP synthase subunit B [Gammaproteobacteria bacterium RBG_16_51_14]|nr:MAG: F0F1 ATP synthase subunit B [Gammaproteobacteria bacterium RBG_16_51_14]
MNFNATLIGQMIAFAVFTWFCLKFIWPPIIHALEERKKTIADGLAAGEKGRHELELARGRFVELTREGKQGAAEIIALAQKRGDEIIDKAKEDARLEGEHLLAAARAEIEQERLQAKEHLRKEVAALAIAGAEQILMREVDRDAHNKVLERISATL